MTEIQKFYDGKTIFVTGATGYLGKMTVEKLLRSCNVKKIILLLRTKKGEHADERFETFFDSPVFKILTSKNPDFKLKVEILQGDLRLPNLGLEPGDMKKIMEEVEVIFHWAATVNFTENLKVATDINVTTLRDLLNMAKNMSKLKSFLHVSTAYSYCIQREIGEVFYDTLPPNSFIDFMDSIDEKMATDLTPGFLRDWPNTYAFTKAVAENLIKEQGFGLPVGILRPSIITSTYKELVPGWLGNLYGYTGLAITSSQGYVRVAYGDPNIKVNLVPADYVVNCAIGAAWQISNNQHDIPIYNYADSPEHSLSVDGQMHLTYKHGIKYPSTQGVWHYFLFLIKSNITFYILDYFLHYIPALLMDFIFANKKIKFVRIYNKFHKLLESLKYFTLNEWKFKNNNVTTLWNRMSKDDQQLFEFDMNLLDWDEYWINATLGAREYILKETLDNLPAGRRHLRKLKIIHYATVSILLFAFACITYLIFKIVI